MKLDAIKQAARDYWVTLVTLSVITGGLVVLVVSQHSDDDWRAAQIKSEQTFARHLRAVRSAAAAANARALAQQSALDRQAGVAVAPSAAGAAAPTAATRPATNVQTPDSRQVAQEFAMFYAKLAANEDHPASQAQVQALARQLAASCSAPRFGQYPCVVHLPGRTRSIQNCVAVVGSSGSVTGRCGVGSAPAPLVASGYVDCASVGRVVSVTDASGDEKHVASPPSSGPLVPGSDPRADLLEVRVAATPTSFCADFHTAAPPSLGSWLGINITRNGAPDLLFAPTINFRDSRSPQLQSPVNTPIAGQVGTSGDWTSLVIVAGDPVAPLPRQPFEFRAYANHEVFAAGTVDLTTDSAPDVSDATYP